jgi:hypothetical protein
MSENTQAIFVSGMYLNRVHEKAPAFVITNQDIHVEKLITWLQENKHLANDKGYIRITGKESQTKDNKGFNKRYFQVDTYKKDTNTENVATTAPEYPEAEINPQDVPF